MRTLRGLQLVVLLSALGPTAALAIALARPATPDKSPPPAPSAAADKAAWVRAFRQLDPAGQRRALDDLLCDRAQRAAAVASSDREFVELQAYHAAILQRARAGQKLSQSGLQALWDQADALERRAVESLSRRYALALLKAFRKEPRAGEQRLEAWERVFRDWQQAGGHADQQPLLLDWLSTAIRRFEQGRLAYLPPRPKFDQRFNSSVRLGIAAAERSFGTPPPLAAASKPLRPRSQPPVAVLLARRHVVDRGEGPWAEAVALFTATAPRRGRITAADRRDRPTLQRSVVEPPDARRGRLDPAVLVRAVNAPPTVPIIPVDTRESAVATTAATAAAHPPRVTVRRLTVSAAGHIDVVELRDRLAGFKVALDALNGRLHDDRLLDSAGLADLVDALEELVVRRGDLKLYMQLLADEGTPLPALESPLTTVSFLSAKISAARLHIERHPDEAQLPRQHAELAALDQLSRRVAVLAVQLQEQR